MADTTQRALIAGLFGICVLAASPAPAAQAPAPISQEEVAAPAPSSSGDFRVAVIDSQRVVDESTFGRELNTRAQAIVDDWEARIAKSEQEFDALVKQLTTQELLLNEQAKARLEENIQAKQVEVQRLREDANRDLQTLQQTLQDEINAALVPLLEEYAKQRGFNFVFDTSRMKDNGLLYWSEEFDITTNFIQIIDRVAPLNEATGSH